MKDNKCGYDQPWVGYCKSTDLEDNGQCKEHQDKCRIKKCDELAIRGCEHTGYGVCAAPLCKLHKCRH